MFVSKRDGTRLFYEERGTGAPAILLVHSLGDHQHYRHQVEHFARHHRVVVRDLVGFGASTAPAPRTLTFESWAADLAWLVEQLDIGPAVIVGHSMSGAIAVELAASHPELVAAVVLLDPVPIVPLPPFREGLLALLQALQGPHYREALCHFAEQRQFRVTDDHELRERLIEDMCDVPQQVLVDVFAAILAWDGEQAVQRVRAPIVHIVHGGGMPVDLDRVRAVARDFEVGQTVGAGHWAHLLVPDQVNAMIERFVAVHFPAPLVPGPAPGSPGLMGDR